MKNADNHLPRHAPGWKYDLPDPNSPSSLDKSTSAMRTPPSYTCSEYLELSRSTFAIRGIFWIGGGLTLLITAPWIYLFFHISLTLATISMWPSLIGLIIFVAVYWTLIPFLRIDLELPRNEPIRFNRLRRKVYFYQYRYDRIRIFSRSRWGVKPVAYDWDDLIAEA
ncbi:DUF6708 domain-containing protein, partial [Pseudomonas sp. GD03858]